MPLQLRVEFAGAWFHVTAHGNERFVVFRRDADRRQWLEVLAHLLGEMNRAGQKTGQALG
jgi:hypothetical protein